MAIDSISRNTTTSAMRQPVESRLNQEAKAQEVSKRKAEEALQPVVNAQGQATGTLINIVA
ncbi:MAG: hypothetical protein FD131_4765 [Rhodocyclaceae bacterium]|nr:MAG: hypothetical protein FD131_4765 [Rhodocyclaceae bacterium]